MRLHREAITNAIPYYQVLASQEENLPRQRHAWSGTSLIQNNDGSTPDKYAFMIELLMNFQRELSQVTEAKDAFELLKTNAKKIIPVKGCAYFRYDEKTGGLFQSKNDKDTRISTEMQRYWKEGILQAVFDAKRPTLLPSLSALNSNGSSLSFFVQPAYDAGLKVGMFVILTTASQASLQRFDKDILSLIINETVSQLERLSLRERLNSVYVEMQTYQAKLSNDFRLAAIGELTQGILEDIGTPLQVILSQVDLIGLEQTEDQGLLRIRSQVVKIQQTINRLVKFADVNQKQVAILPCNLNELLREYHGLVKSSLDNLNMECVLNLGKNIPPILTHPNYFFQILANVFGLLKSYMGEFGGLILQTRHENEAVVLRITATADLSPVVKSKKFKNENLNIRIINNFMKKHEGSFAIESVTDANSVISLTFPIRRKIRQ